MGVDTQGIAHLHRLGEGHFFHAGRDHASMGAFGSSNAARKIQTEDLQGTAKGAELGKQLRERRIEAIRDALLEISADCPP